MIVATALLTGLLLVFFLVLDYLEHIDDFMDRGATWQQVVFDYYLNYIPEIVRLISPLAVFLASIYVAGRLAQSMQFIALHSAGVSLMRLIFPFAMVGMALTVGMFFFNGWLVPRTQAEVLEFQNRYLNTRSESPASTQQFRQVTPESILSVGFYDRRDRRAFRVTLQDFDDPQRPESILRRMDAGEMRWVDSLGQWHLRDVVIRTFNPDTLYRQSTLDTTLTVLPRDLARTERDADRLTIIEAAAYISDLRRVGTERIDETLVSYYGKFSYPLANVILVFIGVPLASVRRRGGQAVQFAGGLLIAFVYLSLQRLIEPFGYAGSIPPIIASWLPHLLILAVAYLIYRTARR